MELILPFEKLGKGDAAIAGGKGASLGEMTQAGIPVPPGFVVLANAFERFLDEANLNQELDTIFHTVNHQEMHTVELASERIQSLITRATMPEDIARMILNKFKELECTYVAVRSSATAEDSLSAAWAGQLDTFLNITRSNLIENVQKCWASLFTSRAIFYRFEKGMHDSKISVAVVIQKMVQSEVSGIAFSVHPVTEDYNQLIIEAGFGLGEAIVSGQITPDSFVVEKEPRRIIDKNVTYQGRALWRGEGGGNEWRELSQEEGTKPALSDEQVLELSEMVLKIETHYGFPCDIEWAFEAGHFFITQSRPVTTLKPANTSKPFVEWRAEEMTMTFESNGIQPIVEHLVSLYYMPPGNFQYQRAGVLREYILSSIIDFLNKKGVDMYKDSSVLKDAASRIDELGKKIVRICQDLALKQSIAAADFDDLIGQCGAYLAAYERFDTWYSDGAYPLRDNPSVAAALKYAEDTKNVAREELTSLMLTPRKHFLAVLGQIASQFGVPEDDIVWYFTDDIHRLFDGVSLTDAQLSARKIAYTYRYSMTGQCEVLFGEEAIAHITRFEANNSARDKDGVMGQVANSGSVVRGTVRVINSDYMNFSSTLQAMSAMQEGDVLIAPTTAPDLMTALKKASAIVTDVGGMLSHAALVARELKKPCIVGTKIASRIFKDGDVVEVDADNGVVRKL